MTVYRYCWAQVFGMPSLGGTRKGQRCVMLARGAANSALVQFAADGLRAVVSRNALRRA